MNPNLGPRPEQYMMPTLAAAVAEASDDELLALAGRYGRLADDALDRLRANPDDRTSLRACRVLNALVTEMVNQHDLRLARDRLTVDLMEARLAEEDGDAPV